MGTTLSAIKLSKGMMVICLGLIVQLCFLLGRANARALRPLYYEDYRAEASVNYIRNTQASKKYSSDKANAFFHHTSTTTKSLSVQKESYKDERKKSSRTTSESQEMTSDDYYSGEESIKSVNKSGMMMMMTSKLQHNKPTGSGKEQGEKTSEYYASKYSSESNSQVYHKKTSTKSVVKSSMMSKLHKKPSGGKEKGKKPTEPKDHSESKRKHSKRKSRKSKIKTKKSMKKEKHSMKKKASYRYKKPTGPMDKTPSPAPMTLPPTNTTSPTLDASRELRNAIRIRFLYEHLEALQDAADQSEDGTRHTGTLGFNLTVDHVVQVMEDAGYNISIEDFTFDMDRDLGDSRLESLQGSAVLKSFVQGQDFDTFANSASANVSGVVVKVPNFGCSVSDFNEIDDATVSGNIALIERGGCGFGIKTAYAKNEGALGVIIYNDANRSDLFQGRLDVYIVGIPVFSTTHTTGLDLEGLDVRMFSNREYTPGVKTQNVIAESPWGDENQIVMAGAHIDTVATSPGLNDNGSGIAALLEIARQIAELATTMTPRNKLRVAFWGAEEYSLKGSEAYLRSLALFGPGLSNIACYFNFEMIGSPNYGYAIYPPMGTDSAIPVEAMMEATFREYFDYMSIFTVPLPAPWVEQLRTRSDHANFQSPLVQIPASGVITGADQMKTEELAAIYGGEANVDFDPCYHKPCDNIDNVNITALGVNAKAYSHAIATFVDLEDIAMAAAQYWQGMRQ